MAYKRTPSNLWRKNENSPWHFKLGIPKPLQQHYPSETPGKFKTHIVQSLKTYNRTEAMRLREPLLVQYRAEFKRLSTGVVSKTINPAQALVPLIREEHAKLAEVSGEDWSDEHEGLGLALSDEVERIHGEILKAEGSKAAAFAVKRMVHPDRASLTEALESLLSTSENTAQTNDVYRLAVRDFLSFIQRPDCFPEEVTDAMAVKYVDSLNTGSLSRSAKSKRLTGLHQVWVHMKRRGWPRSPWTDHKLTNPAPKAAAPGAQRGTADDGDEAEDVRPFTEAEALKVFNLPEPTDKRQRTYTRPLFRELYALGFITGMRLNEIVSLRPTDVSRLDAQWLVLSVPKSVAKTDAAIRSIPVCHPVAVAIIDARLKQQDNPKGRLFSECAPGGRDNKPSWHVSKAMSRERLDVKRLRFTSEVNFHSTRRSFATLLEQSSKGDPIAQQRYMGHAVPSLMHTVYSGGSGIKKLKEVVSGLKYSAALEKALRLALSEAG